MASPSATKALRAGFTVELCARGGSMWPLLRSGDWLRVEPATMASVRRGDIVVIVSKNRLVAHRAVSVDPLVTRGDRMSAVDVPPDADALIGRVCGLRRGPIAIDFDTAFGRALSRLNASPVAAAAAMVKRASAAAARRLCLLDAVPE